MTQYDIYTDGSCINNGKENAIGGWSYVITKEKEIIEENYGRLRVGDQTSMRCEFEAIYQALLAINRISDNNSRFHIHSDYQVIVDGVHGFAQRKTHREYWDVIEPIITKLIGRIDISHIESHSNKNNVSIHSIMNKRSDMLAKSGANSLLLSPIIVN